MKPESAQPLLSDGATHRFDNLNDFAALKAGLRRYDDQRVNDTNQTTAFARLLGRLYHGVSAPLNRLRDLFLDPSRLPEKRISKSVTREAQALCGRYSTLLIDGTYAGAPFHPLGGSIAVRSQAPPDRVAYLQTMSAALRLETQSSATTPTLRSL